MGDEVLASVEWHLNAVLPDASSKGLLEVVPGLTTRIQAFGLFYQKTRI